jgi:hypothetical protein
MKKILVAAYLTFSITAFAQKNITVDEAPRPMSKDTQFSYLVEIPQAKVKQVEKDWLKYISIKSKGKATVVNGENLQTEAVYKNISPNPFNVYSKLVETTDGVNLTVWLTDNNAAFISKTPNSIEDLAVQKYVRDFAVQEYKLAVEEELKMERNKLNDIEKQQASLIKDEEKSNKKINDNLRAIAKAKDKIVTTQSDIDAASVKIENQKTMVDKTAADANATKGAKKTLNDLEKDKVKSQKNTDGDAKDIESWEKEIREEQRNIADGKQKQGLKLSDIDAQKQIVYGVQTKLSNIK